MKEKKKETKEKLIEGKRKKEKAEEICIYTQGHAGLKRCFWAFDFGLYHSTQLHIHGGKGGGFTQASQTKKREHEGAAGLTKHIYIHTLK